jgi:uncharacterized protein YbjQ (UPF0145 family)
VRERVFDLAGSAEPSIALARGRQRHPQGRWREYRITLFTALCEKARGDAFALMLEHGAERGANAIIGMRYDANDVSAGVTEVLAYGTAVVV